jgi:hypothetical protein
MNRDKAVELCGKLATCDEITREERTAILCLLGMLETAELDLLDAQDEIEAMEDRLDEEWDDGDMDPESEVPF